MLREEAAMSQLMLDRAGRRRSPATLPGFHVGQSPGNKGHRYPADPPMVEEIVAVMRAAGDRRHGQRMRALIVILWRAGLRIHEALGRGRLGRGSRRAAGAARQGQSPARGRHDGWALEQLQPRLELRRQLPVGPLLCVIAGSTRGRHWSSAAACAQLRRVAASAGLRRRFALHQLRHAHAVEMAREGVPLILQGIDAGEISDGVHARRTPWSR